MLYQINALAISLIIHLTLKIFVQNVQFLFVLCVNLDLKLNAASAQMIGHLMTMDSANAMKDTLLTQQINANYVILRTVKDVSIIVVIFVKDVPPLNFIYLKGSA